jgi:hypothetical protein
MRQILKMLTQVQSEFTGREDKISPFTVGVKIAKEFEDEF